MSFLFEPFYVGKGTGKRMTTHFLPCELKRNTPKVNKIKKIMQTGIIPFAIKISTQISKEEANNFEMVLIKSIGRKDLNRGSLANLTDGGDGGNGMVCSSELRAYFSQIRKGVSHAPPTQKTRQKISASLIGRKVNLPESIRQEKSERMIRYNKSRVSPWKGERNPNFGRGKGETNPNASHSFLIKNPEGHIYFVKKGTLKQFSLSLGLGEGKALRDCAWRFKNKGILNPVKIGRCKGWTSMFADESVSNNPLDVQWAIRNQAVIKTEGSTTRPKGRKAKWPEMGNTSKRGSEIVCSL